MTSDYTIRMLTADDAPEAAKLWHLVFGDDEQVVLEFFRLFAHQSGFGACAEADGRIVAAAYAPEGMDYITPEGTKHTGVYLYAVATHPDHRKHGLARILCALLRNTAWQQGKAYLFTKPSEESLYPWYEEKIGAVPVMGGQTLEFPRTKDLHLPFRTLSPDAYSQLRSKLLQGLPHVNRSSRWVEWEHLMHSFYGGGFYAVGDYIADLYCDGSALHINELLPHPSAEQAAQICAALMTATDTARCTCVIHGSGHYVSVAANNRTLPDANPWFGPCYA